MRFWRRHYPFGKSKRQGDYCPAFYRQLSTCRYLDTHLIVSKANTRDKHIVLIRSAKQTQSCLLPYTSITTGRIIGLRPISRWQKAASSLRILRDNTEEGVLGLISARTVSLARLSSPSLSRT